MQGSKGNPTSPQKLLLCGTQTQLPEMRHKALQSTAFWRIHTLEIEISAETESPPTATVLRFLRPAQTPQENTDTLCSIPVTVRKNTAWTARLVSKQNCNKTKYNTNLSMHLPHSTILITYSNTSHAMWLNTHILHHVLKDFKFMVANSTLSNEVFSFHLFSMFPYSIPPPVDTML